MVELSKSRRLCHISPGEYGGRSSDVFANQSLIGQRCTTPSLDDLLDAISLATGISTDNIICMAADGMQLSDDLLTSLAAVHDTDHQVVGISRSLSPPIHLTDRILAHFDHRTFSSSIVNISTQM